MARQKLDLQAYQKDILARLKNLAESGHASSSSKLGIRVGNLECLVALADISEVLPVPELMHVPLTQPWFMGMANVRGNLFGVTDLAAFIGNSLSAITSDSRVLVVHQRFGINAGLLVDRLIGLRNLEDMQMQQDHEAKAAWLLNRYADNSGQHWQELDLGAVLSRNEFMQVAA